MGGRICAGLELADSARPHAAAEGGELERSLIQQRPSVHKGSSWKEDSSSGKDSSLTLTKGAGRRTAAGAG